MRRGRRAKCEKEQFFTGQDLGYRYDALPAERDRAAAAWEAWGEENKLRWTSGKVLEKVGEILK